MKIRRILSLVLIICLLSGSVAACGTKGNAGQAGAESENIQTTETQSTDATETETEHLTENTENGTEVTTESEETESAVSESEEVEKPATESEETEKPASESEEMLTNLVNAGMNVARINFSHATIEERENVVNSVKEVRKRTKENVAILYDTKGPEFRNGMLENGELELVEGNIIRVVKENVIGNSERFSVLHISVVRF